MGGEGTPIASRRFVTMAHTDSTSFSEFCINRTLLTILEQVERHRQVIKISLSIILTTHHSILLDSTAAACSPLILPWP